MNKTNEPLAEVNKRINTNYLIISDERVISISLQILQTSFFKKKIPELYENGLRRAK